MKRNYRSENTELTETQPEPRFENILNLTDGMVMQYKAPFEDKTGDLKLATTNGMGIVDSTMVTNRKTKPLEHYNGKAFVEMNFMVEGNIYQTHEGILKKHPFAKGYHNILYNPFSAEKNEFIHEGRYRVFSIHIQPEKMIALFTGYVPEFIDLAEKIDKGIPFVLHTPGIGFDNRMKYIFDTIWQYPVPLSIRKLYFESKILELLSLQCEALMANETTYKETIQKSDLNKVHYAREIVLSNLSEPLSFSELSRLCGLNEFKLKKYFKAVFGTSVFGLVQDQKLEEAKHLIYQGEKNISEIAYDLGYAHPQHFHRAFKKRFGITPKELVK